MEHTVIVTFEVDEKSTFGWATLRHLLELAFKVMEGVRMTSIRTDGVHNIYDFEDPDNPPEGVR